MPRRRQLAFLAVLSVVGLAALFWMLSRKPDAVPIVVIPASVKPLGEFTIPPPPVLTDPQIRPRIKEALGTVAPLNYRTDIIRALPARSLNSVETEVLLTAMVQRPAKIFTLTNTSFMHEIACVLQQYPAIRERFARALATLTRDVQRDTATRDYAIQHLRTVWNSASNDPALRAAIVATFREFAGGDAVIAPSGLLSLHMLRSNPTGTTRAPGQGVATIAPEQDIPAAFHLPDSYFSPLLERTFAEKTSQANLAIKMTALRIVNERRLKGYRQSLITALQDRGENTMVRMAAASALGKITDNADLPALAAITPNDTLVAAALRTAVNNRSLR